jgi:uncharacterized protein YjbI with pentapeptide repeats
MTVRTVAAPETHRSRRPYGVRVPSRRIAGRRRHGPPQSPITSGEIRPATTVQRELEHEQTVEAAAYSGVALSGRAERAEVLRCRFTKADLTGCHLAKVRFTDCLFEASDLSNLPAPGGVLERVTVTDSRMTGLALNGGLLSDVHLTGAKVDLTNFRATRFDVVVFADCTLTGADFTEADLRGAAFRDCTLVGAQFHHARMDGARFRRCDLEGIGGITSWQGAVIHPEDLPALSYVLAGALGITIRDED